MRLCANMPTICVVCVCVCVCVCACVCVCVCVWGGGGLSNFQRKSWVQLLRFFFFFFNQCFPIMISFKKFSTLLLSFFKE